MGSLMAGWSSHALDDDLKARFMRNRSLTKEEVEAFWRQHKKPAPEDNVDGGETVVASSPRQGRSTLFHVRSSPPALTSTSSVDGDGEAAASPSASRDWWTRSSWAFLNEPPPQQRREGAGVGQGAAAAV
ncbi:unnamed protein product [Triticum turgidum subsp. durum]|uniref:Uncharacterized protein n=1 Tax=Triticum turgidum subsp. durum TaxID=4567 RepID=A0A9R1AT70_TRITD|nr:unnamed protein product [Triticum turgidum subsp. durum]